MYFETFKVPYAGERIAAQPNFTRIPETMGFTVKFSNDCLNFPLMIITNNIKNRSPIMLHSIFQSLSFKKCFINTKYWDISEFLRI